MGHFSVRHERVAREFRRGDATGVARYILPVARRSFGTAGTCGRFPFDRSTPALEWSSRRTAASRLRSPDAERLRDPRTIPSTPFRSPHLLYQWFRNAWWARERLSRGTHSAA